MESVFLPHYSLILERQTGFNACPAPVDLDVTTDPEALDKACQHLGILGTLTRKEFIKAGGNLVIRWDGDQPTRIFPMEE